MNKREYIEKLGAELAARLDVETAGELLDDFSAHFDEALRAGKTEEEVCQSLGSPAEIADAACDGGEGSVPSGRNRFHGDRAGEPGPAGTGVPIIREAKADRALVIESERANIFCAPGDGDLFRVQVKVRGQAVADEDLILEEEEGFLKISHKARQGRMGRFFWQGWQDEGRTICVEIPRQFRGDISFTGDAGNVRFDGVELDGIVKGSVDAGNVDITSSSAGEFKPEVDAGNITFKGCTGKVTASGDAGNITIINHRGTVHAETDAGNVRVETDRVTDETRLSTDAGNVFLRADAVAADTGLSTDAGNIRFEIKGLTANLAAETDVGNIDAFLGADTRARFRVHDSRVHNEFAGDWADDGSPPPGLPVVTLRTDIGNINVKKLR